MQKHGGDRTKCNTPLPLQKSQTFNRVTQTMICKHISSSEPISPPVDRNADFHLFLSLQPKNMLRVSQRTLNTATRRQLHTTIERRASAGRLLIASVKTPSLFAIAWKKQPVVSMYYGAKRFYNGKSQHASANVLVVLPRLSRRHTWPRWTRIQIEP